MVSPSQGEIVCKIHATDADRELMAELREALAWRENFGAESARDQARMAARNEARELLDAERASHPCEHWKQRDAHGRQLVQVLGRYGYANTGADVQVGDYVAIPGSDWHPARSVPVTRLGSDYQGTHALCHPAQAR